MGIRQNIFISIIIHAMFIASAFVIRGSVRDAAYHVPDDYMIVSLFKEITGTTPVNSQGTKRDENNTSPEPALSNNTRSFANAQTCPEPEDSSASPQNDIRRRNDKSERATSENSKGNITISLNQHVIISEETNMSHSNTKDNESNPPQSPFTKGGLRGIISKGGLGGLLEQNTASQNTGKNQSPYALIRAAIEKAKTYPFLARKKRIEGTVITGFTINSKGYPQYIKVEKSSGSEILDSAAIKIVMKAAPFPEVNGEIVVPITFKITDYTSSR